MNGNKIVIAILVGALCISAAVYFGGQKPAKIPVVTVPEPSESQTEVVVTPIASPSGAIVEEDDLTPIAVAIGKELKVDPSTLKVTKSRQIDEFAVGGVTTIGEETGGAQWWGVKEDGVWKFIYAGQSYPNCLEVAPYHIPAKLLDSCWDETTNTLKTL